MPGSGDRVNETIQRTRTGETTSAYRRPSLADLNSGREIVYSNRRGLRIRREYRVGRWGLDVITREGRRKRGKKSVGEHVHLLEVDVVLALPADYDAAADCVRRGGHRSNELDREHAHDGQNHRECFALSIGKIVHPRPWCCEGNVGLVRSVPGMDTTQINCENCVARFFGESGSGH